MNHEMTELEQLARLVGNNSMDREEIDSAALIEDSLKANLGAISRDKVAEMENEIRNHGDSVANSQIKVSKAIKTKQGNQIDASLEKVLITLYDTREGIIEAFETCNINSSTANKLTGEINRISSCIRYIGGDVEEFEPLNHVSGLTAPNFYKNAEKVIETTTQCYSLGEVEGAKVLDNGKKIAIVFTGATNKKTYKATGSIISEEWTGNEAIDYIYTPGSGKMSVKAFDNGRWSDRSSSGKYKIVWELEETDIGKTTKSVETITNKKEEIEVMPNINPEADSDEDIGNPIQYSP